MFEAEIQSFSHPDEKFFSMIKWSKSFSPGLNLVPGQRFVVACWIRSLAWVLQKSDLSDEKFFSRVKESKTTHLRLVIIYDRMI